MELELKRLPTLQCLHCRQEKPIHTFYDGDAENEREVPATLFVRNIAAKEGNIGPTVRCNQVCYDCFSKAGNGYFVTIEREGTAFYVTQAI